ncbi:hypothetical protein ACHAW5_006256 [Stephanodiscus triporus]|uniref:RING-type E3 ubiquitin transferase n=1 Tax=Stephanodiscus triporus TaxID=2934178 RepID=A0ABD3MLU8_9STRA
MSGLRRLAGGLLLLSFYPVAAASYKYAKICELQISPLVSLEFDPVLGIYSTMPSEDIDATEGGRLLTEQTLDRDREMVVRVATIFGRNNFLRGKNNGRLLDGASAASTASKRTYIARSCPCDASGSTYCLIDGVSGAVPDSCGVPWSDNISIMTQSNTNISDSVLFDTRNIGCFELSSQTVFTRNAWPVVVLWYGALFIFLIFTSNGKFARSYIINKVFPRLRINEGHVQRILARENEMRHRFRLAAVRAANYATPGRLSYLVRTRGENVPNRGAWRRSSMTEEEVGQQATRWWIAQAEHLGILSRVDPPQQVEYVLKTKTFNAERERARRNQMRQLRVESTAPCDEDGINLASTPEKLTTNREGCGPSTPETVVSTSSGNDDDQSILADPSNSSDTECVSSVNASQSVCPVCPREEDTFECTICLTDIEDGEQVGVLPCTHIYHVDCLRQWISRKNACPLCQVTEIASPRPVDQR